MPEYKPYFYYSKFDPNKEPLDKILAFSYESALEHFARFTIAPLFMWILSLIAWDTLWIH